MVVLRKSLNMPNGPMGPPHPHVIFPDPAGQEAHREEVGATLWSTEWSPGLGIDFRSLASSVVSRPVKKARNLLKSLEQV